MSNGSPTYQLPPGIKLRHKLPINPGVIFCIAWSPDGRMLAFGGNESVSTIGGNESLIRLWDVKASKWSRSIKDPSLMVYSVGWSPDGQMLATGTNEGLVRLWNEARQLRCTFSGHTGSVLSVAWSPNGRTLASCGEDGTIRLWDVAARQLRHTIHKHTGRVIHVVWSPNGDKLASCSADRTIRLWDEMGNSHRTLTGHTGSVLSVAWSPNGRTLASGSADGTIRLWDAKTGHLEILLEGHTAPVRSITFSFDSRLLASKSSDQTVRLWRCDTGEGIVKLAEFASDSWIPNLAFHPQSPVLATLGEKDTIIRIWDLDFDALLATPSIIPSVSYTNAKVVLMGETGVGKRALTVVFPKACRSTTPARRTDECSYVQENNRSAEVMLSELARQNKPAGSSAFPQQDQRALISRSDEVERHILCRLLEMRFEMPCPERCGSFCAARLMWPCENEKTVINDYCKANGYRTISHEC